MTILILGGAEDEHAAFMLDHMRKLGHDAEMLDSRCFPSTLGLSHDPITDGWTIRLPSGRILAPGEVRSIYWRSYNDVEPPVLHDPEQAFLAFNDSRALFESFLIRYPTRWVNGWTGFRLHQTKPAALAMVAQLGIDIPQTLTSNDPALVRAFVAKRERVIFKPVQGGAHTRPVTSAHLSDDNLKNLRFSPVTLQEEIAGTNVRVFVVGERIIACEVRSTALDFRDEDDPIILPHELPVEMQERSRLIAKTLHLCWTGIDYRLTQTGRYVFLEANPSPMFLGFESRGAGPITEALTEILSAEVGPTGLEPVTKGL